MTIKLLSLALLASFALAATAPGLIDAPALYRAQCAGCHGAKLQGGAGPALHGTLIAGEKPDDIYKIVKNGMPMDNPGSLTDAQARALTALIVSANHPR